MSKSNKAWIIYDSRYTSDPDSASVFLFCHSKAEAMRNKDEWGDSVIVEYDTVLDADGAEHLLNPKIIRQ